MSDIQTKLQEISKLESGYCNPRKLSEAEEIKQELWEQHKLTNNDIQKLIENDLN